MGQTAAARADAFKEVAILCQIPIQEVVRCMGAVTHADHQLMIVTEYVHNGSLFDLMRKKRLELSPKQIRRIALDIAVALQYLHAEEVIHRDLKPENVMITEYYRAKLADFGLAKLKREGSRSSSKGAVGTPLFHAPELQFGGKPSTKSDIYSFGLIIFEMIKGHRVFEELDLEEYQIVNLMAAGQLPLDWDLKANEDFPQRRELPDVVLSTLKRLTSFSPDERPTAEEFRELLEVIPEEQWG